jgi:hypothetical protein
MRSGRLLIRKPDAWIGILAALGIGVYVLAAAIMHEVGYPLDDAWIHQTYARNLAQRGEWAFVPGESSAASTSPLFTVLLAAGYFLQIPHFAWTFTLGILALAGAGWIGRRLSIVMFPGLKHAGFWTALALVTSWHLIWAASSGMETMLFSSLSLAVVGLAWRALPDNRPPDRIDHAFRRGAVLGLTGAALTLARPEGVGLVALAVFLVPLARPRTDRNDSRRLGLAWAGGVAIVWAVGVAPYLLWNYHISGEALPATSAAKQAEYAIFREHWSLAEQYGRLLLPLLGGSLIVLVPGIVAGVYGFARRIPRERHMILFLLPLGWACLLLSAYAVRLPANYQHGRYVMPILPHLMLYGVGGTLVLLRAGRRRPAARVLSRSLALSAVLVTAGFWGIGAQQYARDVRIINTEMVDAARWVERHVPPDDLLAVHDIGALGYFAPRPIFDLAGLVSPEVVPIIRDKQALMQMMCTHGVRYLMVFPDQRPAEPDDPRLGTEREYDADLGRDVVKPLFRTEAPYARQAGGNNMLVYQLNWPPGCD